MPAEHPLLYTYRRCPYAMRARMALLHAGLRFDAHEIALRDKPPALLRASPKGTVPVLVLPDGEVIEQSWDIIRWALTHPQARPEAGPWWALANTMPNLQRLQANDTAFKHHLDRYKYPERFGATTPSDLVRDRASNRDQAMTLLRDWEEPLRAQPYLGGQTPCATDLAIFPFVRQFAAVDPAWFDGLPLPGLQRWLQHWLGCPLFQRCMIKLPTNQVVAFEG